MIKAPFRIKPTPPVSDLRLPGGFFNSFSSAFDEATSAGLAQKGLTFMDANDLLPESLSIGGPNRLLSRAEAQERQRDAGVDFHVPEGGIQERAFNLFAHRDRIRMGREARASRTESEWGDFWGSIAGGLAGSVADPVQAALSLIPMGFAAGARKAAIEQTSGTLSRAAVRAQYASAEAFSGAVVDEVINQALVSDLGISESDVEDPLLNIGISTVAGTALNASLGIFFDFLKPNELKAVSSRLEAQALSGEPSNAEAMVKGIAAFGDQPELVSALKNGSPLPEINRTENIGLWAKGKKHPVRKLRNKINRILAGDGEARVEAGGVSGNILRVVDDVVELTDGRKLRLDAIVSDETSMLSARHSTESLESVRRNLQTVEAMKTKPEDLDVTAHFEELKRLGKPVEQSKLGEALDADIKGTQQSIDVLQKQFQTEPDSPLAKMYNKDSIASELDEVKASMESVSKISDVLALAIDCAGRRS